MDMARVFRHQETKSGRYPAVVGDSSQNRARKANNANGFCKSLDVFDVFVGGRCFATRSGSPMMAATDQPSPWWSATRHADRRPFLMARAAVTKAVRAWFEEQGFAEVETGILQVSPGNETHLHAPRTELIRADGSRATRYLRTSPEFACQETARRGRGKNLRICPRVPRPRARRSAPARIHDAGMVSRQRRL